MPDTIAIECSLYSLSYGELNARVNQLARYLQQQGVGPDVLVGLCLKNSLASVVACLAVLKAGGAEKRKKRPSGKPKPWGQ